MSQLSIKVAIDLINGYVTILFLITKALCRSSMIAIYIRFPYNSSNSDLFTILSNSVAILDVFPPFINMCNSSDMVLNIYGIISIIPSTKHRRQHCTYL